MKFSVETLHVMLLRTVSFVKILSVETVLFVRLSSEFCPNFLHQSCDLGKISLRRVSTHRY